MSGSAVVVGMAGKGKAVGPTSGPQAQKRVDEAARIVRPWNALPRKVPLQEKGLVASVIPTAERGNAPAESRGDTDEQDLAKEAPARSSNGVKTSNASANFPHEIYACTCTWTGRNLRIVFCEIVCVLVDEAHQEASHNLSHQLSGVAAVSLHTWGPIRIESQPGGISSIASTLKAWWARISYMSSNMKDHCL